MAAEGASTSSSEEPSTFWGAILRLLHPIPLTVLLILVGVTLLVAASVLDLDRGQVLSQMARREFARGLITYLFAVTTICVSVVLVLGALLKGIDPEAFDRGKEVLGLLLGVFGTIVGFYFGSEVAGGAQPLVLSEPVLSASSVEAGTPVTLTALVNGGTPPYRYAVGEGPAGSLEYEAVVRPEA